MTPIRTSRLVLRNWRESDRALMHRINSDERVMEFFPQRRSRAESDALMDRLRDEIDADGFGFAAAELAGTGESIGFVGLRRTDLEPFIPKGTLEIGWRLAPDHWGRGYVTEAGQAWLDFAFSRLDAAEVTSFAVWNNRRSLAVMERLGMRSHPSEDFDHPAIPVTHPQLKRHRIYRLSQVDWRRRKGETEGNPGR